MELTILLVPLAAALAPLLAALIGRVLVVPLIVFEIALGILLGPSVTGWVQATEILDAMSDIGLAMLFFMAGNEMRIRELRGPVGKRAGLAWLSSAVLAGAVALVAGSVLDSGLHAIVVIGVALTGTALGTITPILRDTGLNNGAIGAAISAAGAFGEFAPLVVMTVLLSGRAPLSSIAMLLFFVVVMGAVFHLARRGTRPWVLRMITSTLNTSGQFAVRLVVLIVAAMVALSVALGIDFLLGAFTSGLLVSIVLRDVEPEEQEVIDKKLAAVAYGFFVPLFFVSTGVAFPLADLVSNRVALAMVPAFALIMLFVRGAPSYFTLPRGATGSDRRTVALFAGTTLPLVIAVTSIGVDAGVLDATIAASMVGGGMLTVLLFPMLALIGRSNDRVVVEAGTQGQER